MSRINPLDHNPNIGLYHYLTDEQLRQIYYSPPIHSQDQSINPYMWSHIPCNMIKNNTDFKINEEETRFTPFFSFLKRGSNFRPFTTRDPVRREELSELPPSISRNQNISRQQRQSRFDRNRQIHK